MAALLFLPGALTSLEKLSHLDKTEDVPLINEQSILYCLEAIGGPKAKGD